MLLKSLEKNGPWALQRLFGALGHKIEALSNIEDVDEHRDRLTIFLED
jgi:hypothetical protein